MGAYPLEDVALSRWNVLEKLDSEEEIAGFLEGVIEEGGDQRIVRSALARAAQARVINQLVKETDIDRQILCDMFLEDREEAPAPEISRDVILKVAKAFVATPVPV